VTSLQPSKVMAVQAAVSTVFPVSEMSVSGAKVDSGVANQPVGFAAGQKGAEVFCS
jgi:non-canonical (house-cleaning) NTP pyrophosphatase